MMAKFLRKFPELDTPSPIFHKDVNQKKSDMQGALLMGMTVGAVGFSDRSVYRLFLPLNFLEVQSKL